VAKRERLSAAVYFYKTINNQFHLTDKHLMNRKCVGSAFIFALLINQSAHAEVDWVSFIWHNDLFAGKDGGGYTNGAYISWIDVSNEGDVTTAPPWMTLGLSWMLDENPNFTYSSYTLGQTMITPKDITKLIPDPNDAPYAGLLFLRSAYVSVHDDYADTVSTTIGILGPASGAEKMQTFIHKVTGSTRPRGWDSQLENELVGQLSRARIWRLGNDVYPNVDALVLLNASIGNLESSAGTGVIFRTGIGLSESFATAAQITGRISNPVAIDGGRYAYIGATVSYLHNQIFVNGNTFRPSPDSSLRHEQYSLIAGLSYSWSDISVGIAYHDGSSLDRYSTARESFGAITLGFRL
jgi:lipid A 3-O-deacylase